MICTHHGCGVVNFDCRLCLDERDRRVAKLRDEARAEGYKQGLLEVSIALGLHGAGQGAKDVQEIVKHVLWLEETARKQGQEEEREACAKMFESEDSVYWGDLEESINRGYESYTDGPAVMKNIASAIRARGETKEDLAPTKPTPVKLQNAKDLDWHLEPGEEEP